MKNIQHLSLLCILSLASFLMLLSLIFGCDKLCKKTDYNVFSNSKTINQSRLVLEDNQYYPLTKEILDGIRSGSNNISHLYSRYSTFTNVSDTQIFNMVYGNYNGNFNFSDITEFDAHLYQFVKTMETFNERSLDHVFTASDVDSILTYISSPANRDYFFNAEEFSGLDIPYANASICPNQKKYNFSLIFFKPETGLNRECWAIFKCVDEYPEEGTPLYGLFQMLENDFITQFEE
jgi:hypothetical protein